MALPITEKVVIYITQGERLLVFKHVDSPEAGIQVPAGTLKGGEEPLAGALREAQEETGLTDMQPVRFLGSSDFDLTPLGRSELHRRHFFHFELLAPAKDTWIHAEQDPSDGSPAPIFFEFYWVRFPEDIPALSGNLGEMLEKIRR